MFIFLLSALFYINSPFVDMRIEPTTESKVDSQAVYSEQVNVLDEKGTWAKIQTKDTCTGWIKKDKLFSSDQKLFNSDNDIAMVARPHAHIYHVKDTEYGPIITLPFESKLEVVDQFGEPNGRWLQVKLVDGTLAYIQRGDVILNPTTLSLEQAVEFSKLFLGLPYTWGGRSSYGYDCSGFSQMIYRLAGIDIPRNSRDQAKWEGFKEITRDELQKGDLIFFARANKPISHVVIYLEDGKFIHAGAGANENKPYLRYNSLNEPFWDPAKGEFVNQYYRRLK